MADHCTSAALCWSQLRNCSATFNLVSLLLCPGFHVPHLVRLWTRWVEGDHPRAAEEMWVFVFRLKFLSLYYNMTHSSHIHQERVEQHWSRDYYWRSATPEIKSGEQTHLTMKLLSNNFWAPENRVTLHKMSVIPKCYIFVNLLQLQFQPHVCWTDCVRFASTCNKSNTPALYNTAHHVILLGKKYKY